MSGIQVDPSQPDRPTTILDIARVAGVSKSTVSRVLDERFPASRSPNALKVREAAERLGYRRNVFASALRQQLTRTVGVVVPRLTDTTMAMFFESVSKLCTNQERLALVATTGNEPGGSQAAVDLLRQRQVDGIILATDRTADPTAQNLRDHGVKHVCALRSEGGSPAALGNDELGGYLAARHLLDMGHTEIVMINGPRFASNARSREAGFREALEEEGLVPTNVLETDFTTQSAAEGTSHLLREGPPFTATFAATDNLAIGVMSAASSKGLSIPRDISVIGYNDIPLAQHLPTPLTSIRVPLEEIASNALLLLDDESDTVTTRLTSPTLISRRSTQRR